MATTIQLSVPENSPAAVKVLEALQAMGATATRSDGVIRSTVPSGTCAVCGGVFGLITMKESRALGGTTCRSCRETGDKLWREARDAAHRQLCEIRGQLPQVIRDVRAGGEAPTYYRGFE